MTEYLILAATFYVVLLILEFVRSGIYWRHLIRAFSVYVAILLHSLFCVFLYFVFALKIDIPWILAVGAYTGITFLETQSIPFRDSDVRLSAQMILIVPRIFKGMIDSAIADSVNKAAESFATKGSGCGPEIALRALRYAFVGKEETGRTKELMGEAFKGQQLADSRLQEKTFLQLLAKVCITPEKAQQHLSEASNT